MAAKWTADWVNRLFIIKSGVTEIDVQIDLYSDWKEEVKLADNLKHPPAMRAVGGDQISDTQNLGATYFLINDWKIRPQEADHELVLTGNLFTDPAGESVIVPTLGSYTVLVTNVVSNLVDSSVARLDLTQLLNSVYIDEYNGVAGIDEGIGTPTNPVNNIADAFTIALRDNLSSFHIRGSFTLDRNTSRWTFIGSGGEIDSALNIGGFDIDDCHFIDMTLSGTMTGSIQAENCSLGVVVGLNGTFRGCQLLASVQTDDDAIVSLINCVSKIPGNSTPVMDVGQNNDLNVRNHSGGLTLENVLAGTTASVDLDPGHLILDATCTGGTVLVRGVGRLTDNSTGTTVLKDGLVEANDVRTTRKVLTNRMETNPSTGVITIYDDDGASLLTAQLYEDIAGSQTYRGQGAERRNKLS